MNIARVKIQERVNKYPQLPPTGSWLPGQICRSCSALQDLHTLPSSKVLHCSRACSPSLQYLSNYIRSCKVRPKFRTCWCRCCTCRSSSRLHLAAFSVPTTKGPLLLLMLQDRLQNLWHVGPANPTRAVLQQAVPAYSVLVSCSPVLWAPVIIKQSPVPIYTTTSAILLYCSTFKYRDIVGCDFSPHDPIESWAVQANPTMGGGSTRQKPAMRTIQDKWSAQLSS